MIQMKVTLSPEVLAAFDEARGDLSRSKANELALRAWMTGRVSTPVLLAAANREGSS